MTRTLVLVAAFLLTAVDLPATAAQPYTINAILSLTGSGAFLGHAEQVTLKAAEAVINKTGGIRGRPVQFTIADDQSSTVLAVQLANDLIAQNVAVMIGPTLSATCSAISPIINKSGPVEYCVSPGIHPAADSYAFSTSMSVRDSIRGALRYFHTRGWHRVGLLATIDATGQ